MEPTNDLDSTSKTCTKCKQEQPVTEFTKHRTRKDGMAAWCKKCCAANGKAWREANPEKCAAVNKAYYEDNKEKIIAMSKAYYEANKEKRAVMDKAYREANKERIAARKKAWCDANKEKCAAAGKAWREDNKEENAARKKVYYEDNKEKDAARQKVWREANPELCEMRAVIRRANRGDVPSLEIYGLPDREMVKQVRTDKLAIFRKFFGKGKYHLDHMRPLAGAKGDKEEMHKRSYFSNLVYIPASENLSKNAKPFWEWFATLKDQKLKKCIALQDAYNRAIERAIAC